MSVETCGERIRLLVRAGDMLVSRVDSGRAIVNEVHQGTLDDSATVLTREIVVTKLCGSEAVAPAQGSIYRKLHFIQTRILVVVITR